MSNEKYTIPGFLKRKCEPESYKKWLLRKAATHHKRDKKRWEVSESIEEYKQAIHEAVLESKGFDAYTGKRLKWQLISLYDDDESRKGCSDYKKIFDYLPTVDHVNGKGKKLKFKICSWKSNDAKNDLSYNEFLKLCREVVAFADKKL